MSPQPRSFRYPKSARIRRRVEYRAIQASRAKVHTRDFILVMRAGPRRRLGITVTKKVGNAVVRNRIKRVVRETFRLHPDLFPESTEIVAIAKQSASSISLAGLVEQLEGAQTALEEKRRRLGPSRPPPDDLELPGRHE